MTWKSIALSLIIWIQVCLVLGVLFNQISFEKFLSLQISVILLILPSPLKDKDLE